MVRPLETSVLAILKKSLSVAKKFPQYNFREYFVRRLNKDIDLATRDKNFSSVEKAKEELEQMKRMVKINSLYCNEKLVIEEAVKETNNK
jgi:hypothetical protein